MPLSADTDENLAMFHCAFEKGELKVDETDCNGIRTQLHNAAYNNCLRIAEFLLRKNANASLVAEKGYTPLHIAASRGHECMVGLILKYSSRQRVRTFIDMKSTNDGSTALHIAAKNNNYEAVRLILSYGANFEIKDKRGKMPIEVTTLENVRRLLGSTSEMSRAAIKAKHASLSALNLRLYMLPHLEYLSTSLARNRQGYTPLQVAIESNHLPTVKIISEARLKRFAQEFALPGSVEILSEKVMDYWDTKMKSHFEKLKDEDLNEREAVREGSFALLYVWMGLAAFEEYYKTLMNPYQEPNVKMIEEVLEVFGFDPTHFKANYEDDAEHFVTMAQGTRYYQLLNSKDVADRKLFVDLIESVICLPMIMLIKSINSKNLLEAAKKGDLEAAKKCTEKSLLVDMNIQDIDQRRPLHVAVATGNLTMVKFLLTHKADMLVAKKEDDETPLHVAVNAGHLNIVELLLYNCDIDKVNDYVNAKMKSGTTALHLAAKNGRLDIMWSLMEHHSIYCLRDDLEKTPKDYSTSAEITKFFKFIDEIFDDAEKGKIEIIEKFKGLERDLLLAVGNVCDKEGHSVPQVTTLNKHREIGCQIFKMVVDAKKSKSAEFFHE